MNTSVFSFCIFISWCMVPDVKFVFFSGPRRRGSSTSVNSLRIPRAPAQGHGLLSPPSRDQPLMQRWETDFVQHCTYSTQLVLCQSTQKNWENWLPWSVSCLDQLVLEVLNLEVWIVPYRTPSTLSPYWFKFREVSQSSVSYFVCKHRHLC